MTKTTVYQDTCIGCGACMAVAPDLFEMNEEGKSIAKKTDDLTEEETKQAQEGIDVCPVQAIKLE